MTPSVHEFIARAADIPNGESSRRLLATRLALGWANALDPAEHNQARRVLAEAAFAELRQLGGGIPLVHAEAAAMLGHCARNDGADEEAKRYAAEAWAALENGWQTGNWFEASQQVRIARVLLQEEMYQPAEQLLLPAYQVLHEQLGQSHPDSQIAIGLLRDLYSSIGRPKEAALYDEKLVRAE